MNLTIGKLAQKSNVTVETIRHYQRKKLLSGPEKPATGFRQYPIETIARIRFIKHAQQSGFSLKEISELLSLDDSHCSDVRKIAEQKLQKIDEQINSLTMLRNILDTPLFKVATQTLLKNAVLLLKLFLINQTNKE